MMRVVTDTNLVRKGKQYGRIASFTGLGILIAGLVISFRQGAGLKQFAMPAVYGSLIVGFILSNVGIYLANRWVREPRADQSLNKALKGFDNRFVLYNYYLPASHVLLTPTGVVVLVVKPQDGTITCEGERWHHKLSLVRALRFLTEEGLGNPSKEAGQETALMQKFIRERVPEGNVPISTFIVFTAPPERLNLRVVNPTVPVVQLKDLKERVRKLSQDKPMPSQTASRLQAVFDEAAT